MLPAQLPGGGSLVSFPREVPMAGLGKFADVLASAHATFRAALTAADLAPRCTVPAPGTQYLPVNGFSISSRRLIVRISTTGNSPAVPKPKAVGRPPALHVTNTSDARPWYFRTRERTCTFNNFIGTPRTAG